MWKLYIAPIPKKRRNLEPHNAHCHQNYIRTEWYKRLQAGKQDDVKQDVNQVSLA